MPLLTPGAERFVTAETFDALACRPAAATLSPHLENADLLVIAPLTANTLAKLAYGDGGLGRSPKRRSPTAGRRSSRPR